MSNLDDLKKHWGNIPTPAPYNEASFSTLVKTRVRKQKGLAMQYFWASFILQIIVYGLLTHVLIRTWNDSQVRVYCIIGYSVHIPFTVILLKKFKKLATVRLSGSNIHSIREYISTQRSLLQTFFDFKKKYELFLIPISTAMGVLIIFELFLPGEVGEHIVGASITYILAVLSCYLAIRAENKKNFREPLNELQKLLDEYQ